ncbi:MAG: immunoglobulin domain-containing protein, partial [Opitutaceae bacterium]|nr:immunoglobulin domain-containing protein [Opitutaceae bacterium]
MRTDLRRYAASTLCGLLGLLTVASSLRAYVASSSKWTGPIVMHLALGIPSSPLTDGSTTWDSVAQGAMAAWNPYMGSIQFSGVNASSAAKAQGNGINNVFFSSTVYGSAFGSNTLAITVSYASGNRRVEGDVLFNTAFTWDSYRGAIRYSGGNSIQDFYRVALHEFGHVLGLDHPDQSGQSVQAIMNSTISNLDTLTSDDTSGALSIYAPGGLTAPSISSHPSALTVTAGTTAQFSVTATGSAPLAYQWARNGSPISGATLSTLALSNVSTAEAGTYAVTVSNAAGSVTSNGALLTVLPAATAPQFITHPQSQTAMSGSSVTFVVSVSGTPPFSYHWKRDNQTVAIQASPSLTLINVSSANAGSYTVTVSNAAGSATSNAAILTVTPAIVAPVIVSPPISRSVALGNSVSFYVVASGTPIPSYQWLHNGIAIPGATSSTFTIASVATQDAGTYSAVATNSAGSATSPPAILSISEPPTILTGPASLTVIAGQPVSLTVSASGSAPLFYQWLKNGGEIPGATASTFSLTFATVSDAGTYTVRVTNSGGSVVSSPAILTVTPASFAPLIQSQPQSATVAAGGNVTLSVGATGLPPPVYQWSKNGAAIPGATSASLVLNNLSPTNAGSYTVLVSNSLGSITSSAAVLTVTTPPAIVSQPASQTVTAGDTVSLSVVASGTAPLSYQWKRDSSPIAGANGSTLSFTPIALSDAGSYTVTVQNALGSVTSSAAVLTVQPPFSPPKILTQPASQTAISGNTVTFSVLASGLPTPSYQWFNGAAHIPGATDASFSMSGVSIISSGSYRVVVSNSLGTATSDSAFLTVL